MGENIEPKNKVTEEARRFDMFIANYKYPDASLIFRTRRKTAKDIKDDCIVVLDTNVLLAPYNFSNEKAMQGFKVAFKQCCQPLVAQNRLVVPGQVAREFAENRTNLLEKLATTINSMRDPITRRQMGSQPNPLIDTLTEYEEVQQLAKEINALYEQHINPKIKEYAKKADALLKHVMQWEWDDPITQLYAAVFSEDTVVDILFDHNTMQEELQKRFFHRIPPGYKDQQKEDSGIGDLLVWQTILHIGRTLKKDVMFVTGEQKPDWFHHVTKHSYPHYELLYEFAHASEGKAFAIVNYPQFLELYNADETVVSELRVEAQRQEISSHNPTGKDRWNNWTHAKNAVYFWLRQTYPNLLPDDSLRAYGADFGLSSLDGTKFGVDVQLERFVDSNHLTDTYARIEIIYNQSEIEHFFVVSVVGDAISAAHLLENWNVAYASRSYITHVVGFLDDPGEFVFVGRFGSTS